MKLSDYVIRRVSEEVKHLFLLPGGGCMHLVDSVGRCGGMEYVCNLHEQACAIAADAYGQYTNRLGAALVTTGPGGTNAVTGVAAAWLESTPCLFLSGQVKRADMAAGRGVRQMGFQEIEIVRIVEPITKYAVTVTDPATIRYHVDKALFLARSGRPGPVWIDIPLDVQAAEIDEEGLSGFQPPESAAGADRARLRRQVGDAIELLNRSERPVILAGNGIRLAGATPALVSIVESLGVPVLTTWKTIDFFADDHPLFMGRPGSIGQRGANFTQQTSDWLLAVGARLDFGQTGYDHRNFARGAKKIVVDVDPAEMRKLDMDLAMAVESDAGEFLREFSKQLSRVARKDRSRWLERCREWKKRYPVIRPEYWEARGFVDAYVLVDVLSDEMSADDLLIPGVSGQCSEITMQAFRVKKGMRIFSSHGLGAMGFGIAASLSGCLASGRRRTVCVDGDGGFHMNAQELQTVRDLNLPVKYFVLNNQGYGSIRNTQRSHFSGRYVASTRESGEHLPDTLRVAGAYGIQTAEIRSHDHIRQVVREVLSAEGPVVCDVLVDPDQATSPRVTSRQQADGSMVSSPLEDLWPFLDREEFRRNMEDR